MGPRHLRIYRSLNQESQILGCERELILVMALISFTLVFVGLSPLTFSLGLGVWTLSLYFLRKMAKFDPKMSRVYAGHVRHQAFYPSRSYVWRRR